MAFIAQIRRDLPANTALFGKSTKLHAEENSFIVRSPQSNISKRIRRKDQEKKLKLQSIKKIKKREDSSSMA
jgi:hypothetical protein